MESWNQIIEIDDPWTEKDSRDKSWILIELIWASSYIHWVVREFIKIIENLTTQVEIA